MATYCKTSFFGFENIDGITDGCCDFSHNNRAAVLAAVATATSSISLSASFDDVSSRCPGILSGISKDT
ncbi:hypothetical protein OIU74_029970 [Salix koriyanagi]|uniref:Uncharacterized protein n=1 Tax=Salix koriyanagi TaxID=2511006 RepID=A0A9Q0VF50_9ROSI|nr:hypothetical protein OIU74_029970 [Salix koriyanagi]